MALTDEEKELLRFAYESGDRDPLFEDETPTPEETRIASMKFSNTGRDAAGQLKREAAAIGADAITPPDPGRKAPEYGAGAVASTQFGQGLTSGLSRSVGAAVDTGLSKLPFGIPGAVDKANEALGGSPGLSPLSRDLTYQQRLSEYAQRDAEMAQQRPWLAKGANLAGAVVGAAAPLSRMTTPTLPGAMALGGTQGAVAGAGYNVDPSKMGRDIARGVTVGTAFAVPGAIAQKTIAGSAARNEGRAMADLGVKPATVGKTKVAADGALVSKADDVREVLRADRELRAAAGNPREVARVSAERMREPAQKMGQIYESAEKASAGVNATEAKATAAEYLKRAEAARKRAEELVPAAEKAERRVSAQSKKAGELANKDMSGEASRKAAAANVAHRELIESRKAALAEADRLTAEAEKLTASSANPRGGITPESLRAELETLASAKGASPEYKNRVTKAIGQVEDLASDGRIHPQRLRDFITEELAPTSGEKQTKAARAVSDVAVALRDRLHGFVKQHAGDKALADLEAANKTWSTYRSLQDSAARKLDSTQFKAPQAPKVWDSVKAGAAKGFDKAAAPTVAGVRPMSAVVEGTRSSMTQGAVENDEDVMRSPRHAPARSVIQKITEGKPLEATDEIRNRIFGGQ